jgi:transposase
MSSGTGGWRWRKDADRVEGHCSAGSGSAQPRLVESATMIQVTPQMRIVAAVEPIDFRCGIDGLARLCKEALKHDPFNGWVFVFRNRSAKALKILVYDGQGFWLCQNMHDSHCAVIEIRKNPLPLSSDVRPGVGRFWWCGR